MASRKEDDINFDRLEKELYAAVDADERYWRENDAKFRAVSQKVGTYDEFRDIVKAAHLKPLEKGDKITDTKFSQTWNVHASKKTPPGNADTEISKKVDLQIPNSSHDFLRFWKKHCPTDHEKHAYIRAIGPEMLGEIFRNGCDVLDEIVATLNTFSNEDTIFVLSVLENLGKTNRFKLSVQFFGANDKQNCAELVAKLEEATDQLENANLSARLGNLKKLYMP